jgi:predicted nucleic-acid-binding Zn-ribbon protein
MTEGIPMTEHVNYKCLRCNHRSYEVGEMYVAGGFWSKVFDVEGRKFSTVTCTNCRHTEFFNIERSKLANVLDLFVT